MLPPTPDSFDAGNLGRRVAVFRQHIRRVSPQCCEAFRSPKEVEEKIQEMTGRYLIRCPRGKRVGDKAEGSRKRDSYIG